MVLFYAAELLYLQNREKRQAEMKHNLLRKQDGLERSKAHVITLGAKKAPPQKKTLAYLVKMVF